MAVPKKKTTKAKRDQRRAHWKVTVSEVSKCPSCGAFVRPYHVCVECGKYKGRQVLALKDKTAS